MITTVELSDTGQLKLPTEFCKKNNIKPGSSLRVVQVGNGLFVTAQEAPDIAELERLISETGVFDREATANEEKMVQDAIDDYRRQKGRTK